MACGDESKRSSATVVRRQTTSELYGRTAAVTRGKLEMVAGRVARAPISVCKAALLPACRLQFLMFGSTILPMQKWEKPPIDPELRRRIEELIEYKGGGHNSDLVVDIVENALKLLHDVEA